MFLLTYRVHGPTSYLIVLLQRYTNCHNTEVIWLKQEHEQKKRGIKHFYTIPMPYSLKPRLAVSHHAHEAQIYICAEL